MTLKEKLRVSGVFIVYSPIILWGITRELLLGKDMKGGQHYHYHTGGKEIYKIRKGLLGRFFGKYPMGY